MPPFTVSTRTDSFRRPELSEDRIAVHHVPGGLVVVVADGAGGTAGGGPAADLVLRVVAAAIAQPGFNPFARAAWTDVLIAADTLVVRDRVAGETARGAQFNGGHVVEDGGEHRLRLRGPWLSRARRGGGP